MPTGYTEPILKGKVTNFKDYAKLCMRAFGATIHMRDDSLDVEYSKREPTDYHMKALKSWEEKLIEFKSFTDEQFLEKRRSEIKDSIDYHAKKMLECEINLNRLTSILTDVNDWVPPTEDHQGIKEFMVNQIEQTIKGDADFEYHSEELERYNVMLETLNVDDVKRKYMDDAIYNINYHIKHNTEELRRVKKSNDWVETFLNSL